MSGRFYPESVTPERRASRMPGFNVADEARCLLRRVNFVGRPHLTGMQKTEAFRAGEGVKASRIQVYFVIFLFLLVLFASYPLHAEEQPVKEDDGTILNFWPLFDYRASPRDRFSNLSILGPLIKFQRDGTTTDTAVRPLFYRTENVGDESAHTYYLYPLASSDTGPDGNLFQILRLYQKRTSATGEAAKHGTMVFPFYMTGRSEKYGPYTSVMPFYGDVYERFWLDEFHFVMFPFYGRAVKKGTETSFFLFPFFSTVSGEKESGFKFWPLYGQAEKEGVYRKRFALWPVFLKEDTGLDTDTPTSRFYLFPLFTSEESKKRTERHFFWPFFGYVSDSGKQLEERDYLWPLVVTIRSDKRNLDRYLPFYSEDRRGDRVKRWYLWPLYSHEESDSERLRLEKDRVLFFLYLDSTETWVADGKERRRVALWPFFNYRSDERGVKTVTFPAPVEPILNKEGIDKSWAPLWRLYVQKWNNNGDSAVSFLWNLYWHERRNGDLACELFPLVYYRSEKQLTDLAILKGLIRYRRKNDTSRLNFLWLPFGFEWASPAIRDDRMLQPDSGSGI